MVSNREMTQAQADILGEKLNISKKNASMSMTKLAFF